MRKVFIIAGIFAFLGAGHALAITAEVDKFDPTAFYTVIPGTANVVFLDQCSRNKLAPYQWNYWEGNNYVRTVPMPMAEIFVHRDSTDTITSDIVPFIELALKECVNSGGNLFCIVKTKQNKKLLGFESVTFRAYRQVYQTGNPNIVTYYNELATKGLPLKLKDVAPPGEQQP